MQRSLRMKKELVELTETPPVGISCWLPNEAIMTELEALMLGPDNSPYAAGGFKLKIHVPERYPFEPPQVQFLTKIYHPNIDSSGRICLDLLKMPPKGAWKPSFNLVAVLASIRLLLAEPNPDDPLMSEIAEEFQLRPQEFARNAVEWTRTYSQMDTTPPV